MIYTYEYDSTFIPSMPVVQINIGRSLKEPSVSLQALLDSGAGGTIIPVRYLRQVRARRERTVWMRTVTGTRSAIDLYFISLQFGPFHFRDLIVAGGLQPDEVIIGRDILNQFVITLNGLASTVELSQ